MITVTKNNFHYNPTAKKLEVEKTTLNWEGVPANLIGEVENILRYPTTQEKVIALHMMSKNIFHYELIAQLVEIKIGTVGGIIAQNLKAEYQKINKQKNISHEGI